MLKREPKGQLKKTAVWFVNFELFLRFLGSISVSGQLPTYPSPNSTTVN